MEKNCSKDFSTWERAENTAEQLFSETWNIDGTKKIKPNSSSSNQPKVPRT